ncbi:MAG: hypothetical protein WA618_15280 [Terriglobales bacterium]
MGRVTAFLLLAGCISLPAWAQEQKPADQPGPAATQQKSSDQPPASESKPEDASGAKSAPAPAAESTEFYLDKFQEFSAIMTGSVIPNHDDAGHIYRSHDMMRMQGNHAVPSYFVTDLKKKVTHGLAASGCMKLSTPYSRAFPFFLSGPDTKYTYETVGEDTIDGHPVKIVNVTISVPRHPEIPLKFFEAQDLEGFPIRIENRRPHGARWTLEYTDVKLGPPDPSLFIVPDKCQDEKSITGHKTGASPKSPASPSKPKQ